MNEIKNQIITEKTIRLLQKNQYTFNVDSKLTKTKIKDWIERFFDVKVKSINSLRSPRKKSQKRLPQTSLNDKRMIITLKPEYSIPLFINE
uniref:Large ribosomal subunit protein uL23c n=2 Tax=Psilotum nudum TaxID=3240 RepID=RK23_PSINU|nr:ribosomal protein L23 [Psilotum nudum]Q8WHY0.1 RecName: Full=Large ribosomal subunit protein uL23c; AltName: Full=50S ribosomal protein L23, chloroplastic [Psilotum nudum]AGC26836.1 ribosomal protein L23 [Psilotum nudum]BAB84259.1 ribosomal protein L23 [Psilotum nudum]